MVSFVRIQTSNFRLLVIADFLCSGLRCFLLFFVSSTRQRVDDAIVAFVASMLKYRSDGLLHRKFAAPRVIPGGRIIDRECVRYRIGVRACEAFRYLHIPARAPECGLVGKIGRFDNQRLAFPMTSRASEPLTHAL